MSGTTLHHQASSRTRSVPAAAHCGLRPELAAFYALAARQSRNGTTGEQRGILAELLGRCETD